jgi:hypothetical protein
MKRENYEAHPYVFPSFFCYHLLDPYILLYTLSSTCRLLTKIYGRLKSYRENTAVTEVNFCSYVDALGGNVIFSLFKNSGDHVSVCSVCGRLSGTVIGIKEFLLEA